MTDDVYLIAITALLPLTAVMLVLQVNPYQALVMRGILGAIAALVYALFGAADVALTEALVGTMLSITLYAVAVRSSMEMRLGWVQPTVFETEMEAGSGSCLGSDVTNLEPESESVSLDATLTTALTQALTPEHLRLEVLTYSSVEALEMALKEKQIHSAVLPFSEIKNGSETKDGSEALQGQAGSYYLQTRVKRLYEILSDRLPPSLAEVDYWDLAQSSAAISSPSLAQPSISHAAQESP